MTEQKLREIEEELTKRNYKKSTVPMEEETYYWYKNFKENEERLYLICFRVWDFSGFRRKELEKNPFSMDCMIYFGGSHERLDLLVSEPKFTIQTTEALADSVYKILKLFCQDEKRLTD